MIYTGVYLVMYLFDGSLCSSIELATVGETHALDLQQIVLKNTIAVNSMANF